jgi:hypothetical protein
MSGAATTNSDADVIELHIRAELSATKAQRGTRTSYETERRSVLAPRECAALIATGRFKMYKQYI